MSAPSSPLHLTIAPSGAFKFTWNGWPLTMFTLPEAYHVKQDYPYMTIVDGRIRVVDDDFDDDYEDSANNPSTDNETNKETEN